MKDIILGALAGLIAGAILAPSPSRGYTRRNPRRATRRRSFIARRCEAHGLFNASEDGCPACGCQGYLGSYRRKMEVRTTHVDAQTPRDLVGAGPIDTSASIPPRSGTENAAWPSQS
jgi:hypothetical protein